MFIVVICLSLSLSLVSTSLNHNVNNIYECKFGIYKENAVVTTAWKARSLVQCYSKCNSDRRCELLAFDKETFICNSGMTSLVVSPEPVTWYKCQCGLHDSRTTSEITKQRTLSSEASPVRVKSTKSSTMISSQRIKEFSSSKPTNPIFKTANVYPIPSKYTTVEHNGTVTVTSPSNVSKISPSTNETSPPSTSTNETSPTTTNETSLTKTNVISSTSTNETPTSTVTSPTSTVTSPSTNETSPTTTNQTSPTSPIATTKGHIEEVWVETNVTVGKANETRPGLNLATLTQKAEKMTTIDPEVKKRNEERRRKAAEKKRKQLEEELKRRKEKMRKLKAKQNYKHIRPKFPQDPEAKGWRKGNAKFYVSVYTGFVLMAGTGSSVWLYVEGKNGHFWFDLYPGNDGFELGSTNYFEFKEKKDIGVLTEIYLRVKVRGQFPGWFLEGMMIDVITYDKQFYNDGYDIKYRQWIPRESDTSWFGSGEVVDRKMWFRRKKAV